ncbi:MAG: histidine phosphatase family protein [Campylobacterota bacterium]
MKITLVRHSEVIKKYQGKYNGHIDIALSSKGKNDAKELAKKLQNIEFDKIYCSDLLRAKQTLAAFKLSQEPIYTNRLREKSWGRHEGKSFNEIQSEGLEYKNFEQWISALDGEDIQKYTQRIQNYFYETLLKQQAKNILVVTHSGVIKTLLGITKNISLEEAFTINLPYSSYITLDTMSL